MLRERERERNKWINQYCVYNAKRKRERELRKWINQYCVYNSETKMDTICMYMKVVSGVETASQ